MNKGIRKIDTLIITIFIFGFIFTSLKYNISNHDLEEKVLSILKEKMQSHEILNRDKALTGNELIEIINSKKKFNIKVFTGKIITNEEPIIFMMTFNKHLILTCMAR